MKETVMKRTIWCFLAAAACVTPVLAGPNDSAWVPLFRPDDLTLSDWTPKFTGRAVGVNQNGVFRNAKLADSTTRVLHALQTQTYANTGFGHLFYNKRAFTHYIIRAEYRFPDSTSTFEASQGNWTVQNNGLMLHAQAPNTMTLQQDFPISLEAQLLGPKNVGADNNSTMNLCTPGTAYFAAATGGSVVTTHCTSAANNTRLAYPNWNSATARMYGGDSAAFYVGSTRVFTFYRPVYSTGNVSSDSAAIRPANNTALTGGYITVQDEGTSTEFRTLEILNLVGCMTPTDANYKTYFVKNDSTLCGLPAGVAGSVSMRAQTMFSVSGSFVRSSHPILRVEIRNLQGALVSRFEGNGARSLEMTGVKPGVYVLRVKTAEGSAQSGYVRM
jgi:hypothetical protein